MKGKEDKTNSLRRNLRRLKRYERDRKEPEVDRALQTLRDVFKPVLRVFQRAGITLAVHGSLQYNDPRNLDADLIFVGRDVPRKVKEFIWSQEERVSQRWPRQPGDTDFITISLKDIRRDAKMNDIGGARRNDNHLDGILPSMVISGKLLFEEQKKLHHNHRRTVLRIAQTNPTLKRNIGENLADCERIRKERRGIVF